MSNTRLYSEWGAFAGIPYQFIDNASEYSEQARWLFVLLMRHANHETGEAFHSYQLISAKTGWTNKTISKAIKELENKSWITRKKQFSGPTIYTLVRPQLFPTGTGSSSSHREQSQFPTGTTVVPVGTSNKTNINKTNINKKQSQRSGFSNPHYDCFATAFLLKFDYPYQNTTGDFTQYAKWKKLDEGRTDEALFKKAVLNYLASPQNKYTFADLATRFAIFRNSALDRFGKPLASTEAPAPSSVAPLPRGCNNCVQGWILPDSPGGYARRCDCQ